MEFLEEPPGLMDCAAGAGMFVIPFAAYLLHTREGQFEPKKVKCKKARQIEFANRQYRANWQSAFCSGIIGVRGMELADVSKNAGAGIFTLN